MFSVNSYDLHRAFSVFAESEIIFDEYRKRELVAQDLEMDLQILNVSAENAAEEIALKQGVLEWCKET